MTTVRLILIKWVLFWFIVAGGSIYVLPNFGADQYHRFYITSIYFFSFALIGAYYYNITEVFPHHASFKNQLVPIFLISLFTTLACLFVNRQFPISDVVQNKIMLSKFYFPLFNIETIITKLCDISFQQVFIYGILKKLKSQKISNREALTLFSISFFIIHLPLIFSLKLYAFYFIIPSCFAGVIFSYLILNYRHGLVKSFSTHLMFYFFVGLYLRYF
ncbi:MAG: hypothetical protein ABL930_08660 [Pseudobdellovibrio sp.]